VGVGGFLTSGWAMCGKEHMVTGRDQASISGAEGAREL
jgi:hypothetical protein